MKILVILAVILSFLLLSLSACTPESKTPTPFVTPPPTSTLPGNWGNDVIMISLYPIPYEEPDGSLSNQTHEAYDDIIPTPGGYAYRANIHEVGVPDKWPSILTTSVTLENGSNPISVTYRSKIETKAGETRNNLFEVSTAGTPFSENDLKLYYGAVPDGIKLGGFSKGGRPGLEQAVVAIYISPDVVPDVYGFKIGVEFNGKYYDTIPCTINVIQ